MKSPAFNRQDGVALFMSLVMLLILTLLGLSSVQTTSLQERMSRNARDTNLAFQAAESAVREAEMYLEGTVSLTPFQTANTDGRYDSTGAPEPILPCAINDPPCFDWQTPGNNDNGYVEVDANIDGVAAQPKYIIEFIKTVVSEEDTLNIDNIGGSTGSGRTQMFRVTTYGTGGTEAAHVMIQTTYGQRF